MNLRTKLRTICHTPLVCHKINSKDAVLFQLVGVEVAMVNVLVSELRSLGLGLVTRDITLCFWARHFILTVPLCTLGRVVQSPIKLTQG